MTKSEQYREDYYRIFYYTIKSELNNKHIPLHQIWDRQYLESVRIKFNL